MSQTDFLKKYLLDYQKGDASAFDSFFSCTEKFVYNLIKMRIKNTADQDEIFQNVFFRIHMYVASYDEKFNPITWVSRICRNAVFDHLKSKRQTQMVPLEENLFASAPQELENKILLNELVEHCFGEFPEAEKSLLINRIVHDLDYSEMSLALNTSEENVRKKLSRMLLKARTKFKKESI